MRKRSKKNLNYYLPAILIAAVIIFTLIRGGSGMDMDFGDDTLVVSSPEEFSFSVDYDEISSTELVDFTDSGTMLSGGENSSYAWGVWENDAWGEYSMCVIKKLDTAILITTQDGERMVFNYESDDTTASLFQAFNEMLDNRASEGAA